MRFVTAGTVNPPTARAGRDTLETIQLQKRLNRKDQFATFS